MKRGVFPFVFVVALLFAFVALAPPVHAQAQCSPNPCMNGGNCTLISGGADYNCTCHFGFSGRNCSISAGCTTNGLNGAAVSIPTADFYMPLQGNFLEASAGYEFNISTSRPRSCGGTQPKSNCPYVLFQSLESAYPPNRTDLAGVYRYNFTPLTGYSTTTRRWALDIGSLYNTTTNRTLAVNDLRDYLIAANSLTQAFLFTLPSPIAINTVHFASSRSERPLFPDGRVPYPFVLSMAAFVYVDVTTTLYHSGPSTIIEVAPQYALRAIAGGDKPEFACGFVQATFSDNARAAIPPGTYPRWVFVACRIRISPTGNSSTIRVVNAAPRSAGSRSVTSITAALSTLPSSTDPVRVLGMSDRGSDSYTTYSSASIVRVSRTFPVAFLRVWKDVELSDAQMNALVDNFDDASPVCHGGPAALERNDINPCTVPSNPCLNNGTCNLYEDRFGSCTCTSAFIGDRCQTRNPCMDTPCKNGATCIPSAEFGNYTCACLFGFTGFNCTIDNACTTNGANTAGISIPTADFYLPLQGNFHELTGGYAFDIAVPPPTQCTGSQPKMTCSYLFFNSTASQYPRNRTDLPLIPRYEFTSAPAYTTGVRRWGFNQSILYNTATNTLSTTPLLAAYLNTNGFMTQNFVFTLPTPFALNTVQFVASNAQRPLYPGNVVPYPFKAAVAAFAYVEAGRRNGRTTAFQFEDSEFGLRIANSHVGEIWVECGSLSATAVLGVDYVRAVLNIASNTFPFWILFACNFDIGPSLNSTTAYAYTAAAKGQAARSTIATSTGSVRMLPSSSSRIWFSGNHIRGPDSHTTYLGPSTVNVANPNPMAFIRYWKNTTLSTAQLNALVDNFEDASPVCHGGPTDSAVRNDVNPCTTPSNPCLNGGTCLLFEDRFASCRCANGFSGTFCENAAHICAAANPCRNNATCVIGASYTDYTCLCLFGTTGRNCTDFAQCTTNMFNTPLLIPSRLTSAFRLAFQNNIQEDWGAAVSLRDLRPNYGATVAGEVMDTTYSAVVASFPPNRTDIPVQRFQLTRSVVMGNTSRFVYDTGELYNTTTSQPIRASFQELSRSGLFLPQNRTIPASAQIATNAITLHYPAPWLPRTLSVFELTVVAIVRIDYNVTDPALYQQSVPIYIGGSGYTFGTPTGPDRFAGVRIRSSPSQNFFTVDCQRGRGFNGYTSGVTVPTNTAPWNALNGPPFWILAACVYTFNGAVSQSARAIAYQVTPRGTPRPLSASSFETYTYSGSSSAASWSENAFYILGDPHTGTQTHALIGNTYLVSPHQIAEISIYQRALTVTELGYLVDNFNDASPACHGGNPNGPELQGSCSPGPCLNNGACNLFEDRFGSCTCTADFAGTLCQNRNPCLDTPCKNNAGCTPNADFTNYTCSCTLGWRGTNCTINIDECAEWSPCQNGATCIDQINDYNCTCAAGYRGKNCTTEINECVEWAPCRNGATCTDLINDYSCACALGWTGRNCSINIDDCTPNPCQNSGVCTDGIASYTCACNAETFGVVCEQRYDDCDLGLCLNGATCTDGNRTVALVAAYDCACPYNYYGPQCQFNRDFCSYPAPHACLNGAVCVDNDFNYTCACAPGFEGTFCEVNIDECPGNQCQNGATCVDGVAGYTCTCVAGYSGTLCQTDIDDCSPNPCFNGATCSDRVNGFTCACAPGWNGTLCDINIDECALEPCTRGVCTDLINNRTCTCPRGWRGRSCNEFINYCTEPDVLSPACVNAESCTPIEGNRTCNCQPGWTGETCDINIDECALYPCANGATCTDLINNRTCACTPGWRGPSCQVFIDYCVESGVWMAACNATTTASCTPSVANRTCNCQAGWTGEICTTNIDECAPQPCFNGATCVDGIAAFTCICTLGWEGPLCANDTDFCALAGPGACFNGGTCVDGMTNYTCTCAAGWTGPRCEINIDECAPNPCQNGGVCTDLVADYSCACAAGYRDKSCQTNINECVEWSPCANDALCIDGVNNYTCNCAAGWDGRNCTINIDECDPDPCEYGFCSDLIADYWCECFKGFRGKTCQTNIDECSEWSACKNGALCIDGINDYTCTCAAGWAGRNCTINIDDCALRPCLNGGLCTDLVNNRTCTCNAWYSGVDCETNIDDCGVTHACVNGACIDGLGNYTCSCLPGYEGRFCDADIDDCIDNACFTDGTLSCTDRLLGYDCNCKPGYNGTYCEAVADYCELTQWLNGGAAVCKNSGMCMHLGYDYMCHCQPGWRGRNCTEDINECSEWSPCANGATCTDGIHDYNCTCAAGWRGKNCTVNVDECAEWAPCANGATCTDGINDYACTCAPGWAGRNCTVNIDECDPNPCQNGGVCTDGIASYSCACSPETHGSACQFRYDDCDLGLCLNGATCTDGNRTTELVAVYDCACPYNYYGPQCQFNYDFCSYPTPHACINGGACVDNDFDYTCACPPGYEGTFCEVNTDECVGHECQNGATCVDGVFGYNCTCATGWTGIRCETNIDDCAPNPCQNNATCIDRVANFTCACAPGWTGALCETNIDECASQPCFNGATCVDGIASFSCICAPGWEGPLCANDIDFCALTGPDACYNGGICVDDLADYYCTCPPGWLGGQCEINVDECALFPCQNGGDCIDLVNNRTCDCGPWYSGVDCETNIDDCGTLHGCVHGSCVDGLGDYTCACQPGYEGRFCDAEIDECISNACFPDGTLSCTDRFLGYDCNCKPGYNGTYCEAVADYCELTQWLNEGLPACANGGTCMHLGYDYACSCAAGWMGRNCTENINDCCPMPCFNGGTCRDGINSYTCECPPFYLGTRCEIYDYCNALSPCENGGECSLLLL
jgi:hypothetical protein